jgi:hypothetical protein
LSYWINRQEAGFMTILGFLCPKEDEDLNKILEMYNLEAVKANGRTLTHSHPNPNSIM